MCLETTQHGVRGTPKHTGETKLMYISLEEKIWLAQSVLKRQN